MVFLIRQEYCQHSCSMDRFGLVVAHRASLERLPSNRRQLCHGSKEQNLYPLHPNTRRQLFEVDKWWGYYKPVPRFTHARHLKSIHFLSLYFFRAYIYSWLCYSMLAQSWSFSCLLSVMVNNLCVILMSFLLWVDQGLVPVIYLSSVLSHSKLGQ